MLCCLNCAVFNVARHTYLAAEMSIIKRFLTSIFFLNACLGANIHAASGDAEFLQARAAYDKKNAIALSDYVQQLQNQDYLLAPYADYWLMLLNLEDADNQSVTDFLNTYSEYPFTDRLRGEYLKKLAKKQDWESFSGEIANYQLEDSADRKSVV